MASICSGFFASVDHNVQMPHRHMRYATITMMFRCLTTMTGTTRVTKAATTPSHHLEASGTVRRLPGLEILTIINLGVDWTYYGFWWRCVWDSEDWASPKGCWDERGQADGSSPRKEARIPNLNLSGNALFWALLFWHLSDFIILRLTWKEKRLVVYLSIWLLNFFSVQVNTEGRLDGAPLPLPLPSLHHRGCRCFQACQLLKKKICTTNPYS